MMRPKILYEFDSDMTLRKHHVLPTCRPMAVLLEPHGVRWRCSGDGHDFYGYTKLHEAKKAEIERTRVLIAQRTQWLRKLRG